MKLRDKFEQWFIHDEDEHYEGMVETVAIEHEKVADNFAIGFKDWCDKFTNEVGDWKQDGVCLKNRFSTKELLEIYKKEKGL